MSEIPGSPLSRHDIDVLSKMLAYVGVREYQRQEEQSENEIIISTKRVTAKPGSDLRVLGIRLRLSETVDLNEIVYVRPGRDPLGFNFEGMFD